MIRVLGKLDCHCRTLIVIMGMFFWGSREWARAQSLNLQLMDLMVDIVFRPEDLSGPILIVTRNGEPKQFSLTGLMKCVLVGETQEQCWTRSFVAWKHWEPPNSGCPAALPTGWGLVTGMSSVRF